MDGWGSSGPVLDFAGYQTRTWESEGGRVRATVMPARRSSLIGRERDLDTIADLAIHNDGRLVTLTGVGGVGKTALVHEIGRSVIERIPDGVRPVDEPRDAQSRDPLGGRPEIDQRVARPGPGAPGRCRRAYRRGRR